MCRLIVGLLLTAACAAAPRISAPTFQELMDPALFPDPQRGMTVEGVQRDGADVVVTTTGARITLSATGAIRCEQRLGHPRPVATLQLGQPLVGSAITHRGPGLARVTYSRPRVTVRVNGDSLLMLQPHEPLTVRVTRHILPGWHASWQTDHLLADEWGGFGLYCSEAKLQDGFDAYAETVATYALPAEAVLWLCVCPPKAYPWEASLKDNVVFFYSDKNAYPPDAELKTWPRLGNIALLHSEVMMWKDWQLDFVPRNGPAEFARARDTLHGLGMRLMVYASPYYFLRGTPLEAYAFNTLEHPNWSRGVTDGANYRLYLEAATRLMRELRPDGLYLDNQYRDSPAATYALARDVRALVGDAGLMEWHSTSALGRPGGELYLPAADAYCDYVLRGENVQARFGEYPYQRFFVSGYNLHNAIGVLCCNNGGYPTLAQNDLLLRANGRYHALFWYPASSAEALADYHARLVPGLRDLVEQEVDRRQAALPAELAAEQADEQALRQAAAPPVRTRLTFTDLGAGKTFVSPASPGALQVRDGRLLVRAHAHTHAYLALPVIGTARGVAVKLRQGTDQGYVWGPGVALRFAGGACLRLVSRVDRKVQFNLGFEDQYFGQLPPATAWTWLRARWSRRNVLIEASAEGEAFEPLARFAHGGTLCGELAEVRVGKTSGQGTAYDYAVPGPVGECEIAEVDLLG